MRRERKQAVEGEQCVEYRLGREQQVTVRALVTQRQQVLDVANKQIAELNEAIDELARTYGRMQGVPDKVHLVFELRPDRQVVLGVMPPKEPTEGAPAGAGDGRSG